MCTFIIDRSVCSSTALGNNLTFPPIRSKTITFKCNSLLIANAVIVDHFLLKLSVDNSVVFVVVTAVVISP